MAQEETRRGPWTDEEDLQLACSAGLLGERRWDFIAKVSGLKRTGKSCRLRWLNYLHPGLKRGRMTPQEETLVLELHSRWGNRWSKIARKLPGRTDNEIKNYWRTHMRRKAQERKRAMSSSSFDSVDLLIDTPMTERSLHGDEGPAGVWADRGRQSEECAKGYSSMDQIRMDLASLEVGSGGPSCYGYEEERCNFSCPPMASPLWEYCYSDPLWKVDDEIKKWESILTG